MKFNPVVGQSLNLPWSGVGLALGARFAKPRNSVFLIAYYLRRVPAGQKSVSPALAGALLLYPWVNGMRLPY
jgi:hypothetical protein